MGTLDYQEEDKDAIAARDTNDPQSKYKKFPLKPGVWDEVKEAFEPTGTRAMLDSIRRRRAGNS